VSFLWSVDTGEMPSESDTPDDDFTDMVRSRTTPFLSALKLTGGSCL
jgi:hypothetical protein